MKCFIIVIAGLLISTGLFGQELERLISAEKALSAGDTTGSIIIFREVLKKYPDSYAAALRLTEVNYQRALYGEAIQYSHITEDVLLRKLDSLDNQEDIDPLTLKRYYEDLASLYHFKGKIRLKQHRAVSAIEELERALQYNGDSSAIYVDIGLAYFEQNKVENAKAAFIASQRISPYNPSGYFNLGNIYYNNREYDSAAYYYQRTAEADSDFILAYAYLGEIYTLRGNIEEAVTQYSYYLEREPSEEIYFKRAVLYAELRKWENALDDWDRVVDLNPDNASAIRNRGLSYFQVQDYPAAINDFNSALLLDKDPYTYINRGYSHYLLGDAKSALADYDRGLPDLPEYALGFYLRALAYKERRKRKAACTDLARALELGMKEDEMDKEILGYCY